MKKRKRSALPALTADAFADSAVVSSTAPFAASAFLESAGSRERRHARGNWPSHIVAILRGPSSLFGHARDRSNGRRSGGGNNDNSGNDNDDDDDDDDDDESCDEDEREEAETLVRLARTAVEEARSVLSRLAPAATLVEFLPPPSARAPASLSSSSSSSSASSASTASTASPVQQWAHISLARPFSLRRHEIEPFLAALRRCVAAPGSQRAFDVVFGGCRAAWCVLPSEETLEKSGCGKGGDSDDGGNDGGDTKGQTAPHTRSGDDCGDGRGFLALEVASGGGLLAGSGGREELSRLVAAVDAALAEFGRRPYKFTEARGGEKKKKKKKEKHTQNQNHSHQAPSSSSSSLEGAGIDDDDDDDDDDADEAAASPRFHVSVGEVRGLGGGGGAEEGAGVRLPLERPANDHGTAAGAGGGGDALLALFSVTELQVKVGHKRFTVPLRPAM
jgi:hypothetical protein